MSRAACDVTGEALDSMHARVDSVSVDQCGGVAGSQLLEGSVPTKSADAMGLEWKQTVALSDSFTATSRHLQDEIRALHRDLELADDGASDTCSSMGNEMAGHSLLSPPPSSAVPPTVSNFLAGLGAKYKERQQGMSSVDVAEAALRKSQAFRPGHLATASVDGDVATMHCAANDSSQAVLALLKQHGLEDLICPSGGRSIEGSEEAEGQLDAVEALQGVLCRYERQGRLLQEVLHTRQLASEREQRLDTALRHLRAEHERLARTAAEGSSKKEREAEEALSRSASKAKRAEGEVQRLTHQIAELKRVNRKKEEELEKVARAAKQAGNEGKGQGRAAVRSSQAVQRLEAQAAALRAQLASLEQQQRAKAQEVEQVASHAQRTAREAADNEATLQHAQAQVRRLESELAIQQRYVAELEHASRLKEQEIGQLARSAAAAELEKQAAERALEDSSSKLTSHINRLKAQLSDLEQAARNKEAEIQEWMENASVSSRGVESAEAEVAYARQEASRLAGELQRAHQHLNAVQSALREKDDKLAAALTAASHCSLTYEDERHLNDKLREEVRQLETKVGQLQLAVVQAQHATRAREAASDQLRQHLEDKVKAEERLAKRDSQAYARIKRALAVSKGEGGTRGASGALAAACRELRPIEIVSLYEEQREAAELELAMLRAEVRTMAGQLRDAENKLMLQGGKLPVRVPSNDEAARQLAEVGKEAANAKRALVLAEREAAGPAREAARKVLEAERKAEALEEENASLIMELEARPTSKQYRALQRQHEILERRLAAAKKLGGHDLGAAAEDAHLDVNLRAADEALVSSRERMRRDKELHRLGLASVERFPRDVAITLLQDACIALELQDATLLPSALHRLLRVVAAVPRLERFVADVCQVVFSKGQEFSSGGSEDPAEVAGLLETWIARLREGQMQQESYVAIARALASRVGQVDTKAPAETTMGVADMVVAVRQLVAQERNSLQAADTIAAAQKLVGEGDSLLARIVAHFQHLFDCPRLEGVLPAINQVYVANSEASNFRRALAVVLGLESSAGASACMQRVRQILDRHGPAIDFQDEFEKAVKHRQERQQGPLTRGKENWPQVEIRVPGGVYHPPTEVSEGEVQKGAAQSPRRQDESDGCSTSDEQTVLALKRLFKADTLLQVMKEAEALLERLRRLDVVLPKYRQLASQLFEALKVRTLQEVMPAVETLIATTKRSAPAVAA